MAHAAPFAFEDGPIVTPRAPHASSTARPPSPRSTPRESGYKIINEIGVERIREKSMRQTQRLIELAEEAGLRVTSPRDPERRGGTITVAADARARRHARADSPRNHRATTVPAQASASRPTSTTKDEELELVVREMRTILDTRAYAAHEATGAAF